MNEHAVGSMEYGDIMGQDSILHYYVSTPLNRPLMGEFPLHSSNGPVLCFVKAAFEDAQMPWKLPGSTYLRD